MRPRLVDCIKGDLVLTTGVPDRESNTIQQSEMDESDNIDSGLLGIALSDSDAESGDAATATKKVSQEARTAQSEEDFQAVKSTYRAKVENGEVSKPEVQTLLHAVEELYFFRRFSEGARFARSVIEDDAGSGKVDGDALKTLLYYEKKCNDKIDSN
ncbi:hypothetical protein O1611_g3962 [Lasiodiplodia mahajangana]|uniref:Uncharacterized protein n=1 Tax=Lasiodiplodia mahajangana TaxID=1108764 RepID=A0ACC2JQX3_9PEZI|nr:hypothetical protein O1611_g3962 [Lasiodiplodia mahajangana]